MAELSTREGEVLELICRGMSNLEIADALFVSVNSVKTYVRQIYQKIGVTRRAQAVAWGLAHGLLALSGPGRGRSAAGLARSALGSWVSSRAPRLATTAATGGSTAATTLISTAAVVDQSRTTFHASRISTTQAPISQK